MSTSRRGFLFTSPALLAQTAPSNLIRIGLIGAGGRGRYLMGELAKSQESNFAITAVCDVHRPSLQAAAAAIEKRYGAPPKTSTRYQDILANKDVDAVILAAPDHTHARMLKEAVEAGKDVYCEKPMGTNLAEARAAFLAVKRSKQVVQIGTQRRSEGPYVEAARLFREGIIGKVTRVDLQVHFQEPRWRRDHHMVQPADIDWEAFDFGRNLGPFDARKWREWQLFSPLSNGIPGLWMSHLIDLAHWFLDDPYPRSVVASGGVFLWKDGRQTSDVFHALLDYPKDFLVSFAMSLTNSAGNRNLWFGEKGIFDGDRLVFLPEGSRNPDRLAEPRKIERSRLNSHTDNWLQCIRSRETPRADIQAGFSHAVAGTMAAAALETGRRITFDPGKLEFS
ncbi:MAG: Gfo/Idh/MocA family oxidoreductase [Bryobacteraceae bacterium]|nr:Gfo/Idh/MocA family oxidoreductase [Bryobacteraceae bacterium]